MDIRDAEGILDTNLQSIADNYDMSQDEFNIVIKSMKEYAAQFIELAAEVADYGIYQNDDGQEPYHHESNIFVDRKSILKLKEQIK